MMKKILKKHTQTTRKKYTHRQGLGNYKNEREKESIDT